MSKTAAKKSLPGGMEARTRVPGLGAGGTGCRSSRCFLANSSGLLDGVSTIRSGIC